MNHIGFQGRRAPEQEHPSEESSLDVAVDVDGVKPDLQKPEGKAAPQEDVQFCATTMLQEQLLEFARHRCPWCPARRDEEGCPLEGDVATVECIRLRDL